MREPTPEENEIIRKWKCAMLRARKYKKAEKKWAAQQWNKTAKRLQKQVDVIYANTGAQ